MIAGRFWGGAAAAMVMLVAGGGANAQAAPAKPPAFAMCAVCHKTDASEKSTLGPNLAGVGGRKAGTLAGFTYSPAMKNSGITWTREKLLAYVQAPQKVVPGTRMAYAGQKDPKQAAAVVDYVMSLK